MATMVTHELSTTNWKRSTKVNTKERQFAFQWGHVDVSLAKLEFEVDVESTRVSLLAQEDTTGGGKITVDDNGPKEFQLRDRKGRIISVVGTYQLSNLLQELTLANANDSPVTLISGARLIENPVDRLRRMITETFWTSLTRKLDSSCIAAATLDTKTEAGASSRIYVPAGLDKQHSYYQEIAQNHPELHLEVSMLPEGSSQVSQDWQKVRENPGILALAMGNGSSTPGPLEYIVPGGRFNEFYYWDSYFSALGLLESGKVDLVRSIVEHMQFQIEHYGCVLNANRSYYLYRSQPPFLTDLVIRTYRALSASGASDAEDFLRSGMLSAIREYHSVWLSAQRLDPLTDLSRYRPDGGGIPPEVEPGHFDWFLAVEAQRKGVPLSDLCREYNDGSRQSAQLDEFFLHDRAMRESGHDTSARFCGQCADLATIDLNALLYRYEVDIAWAIRYKFGDEFVIPGGTIRGIDQQTTQRSSLWTDRSISRKWLVEKYLWDDEAGCFRDYNTATGSQTPFLSATTFWALWSGMATPYQAERLVRDALPRLEEVGGLASTAGDSLTIVDGDGKVAPTKRQWDHPFGWAPHQMALWEGLRKYGFVAEAKRTAYRWLYLLTRTAVDFNGALSERYDVTSLRRVQGADEAEYGNQGWDFRGVNKEGFGWTNASYLVGLNVIGPDLEAYLRSGTQWEDIA